MSKEVVVLGVGMHPWGKWGRPFVDYGVKAANDALNDAGLEWKDVGLVVGGDTVRGGYPGYAGGHCERPFWACQDANYNVLGLLSQAGWLTERYEYTPYGQRTIFSRNWKSCDFDGDCSTNYQESAVIATHYNSSAWPHMSWHGVPVEFFQPLLCY